MRIENVKSGLYNKKPDKVDAYLLRVAHRFFETEDEPVNNSREAIVEEASRRARAETVLTVKKIVIDETNKYVAEELDAVLETKLGDIILQLKEELKNMKEMQMTPRKFNVRVDVPTNEFDIPVSLQIRPGKDLLLIFINGMLHEDYTFETESNHLSKVNFGETVVYPDDSIVIRTVVFNV